jgi:hypothetical protein
MSTTSLILLVQHRRKSGSKFQPNACAASVNAKAASKFMSTHRFTLKSCTLGVVFYTEPAFSETHRHPLSNQRSMDDFMTSTVSSLVEFGFHWTALCCLLIVIIFEHVCRELDFHMLQPSVWMQAVADVAVDAARWLGGWIARLSSFYTYLHLNRIGQTVIDLLRPFIRLISVPFQFLYGYVKMAAQFEHVWLIAVGTTTLLTVLPPVRACWWRVVLSPILVESRIPDGLLDVSAVEAVMLVVGALSLLAIPLLAIFDWKKRCKTLYASVRVMAAAQMSSSSVPASSRDAASSRRSATSSSRPSAATRASRQQQRVLEEAVDSEEQQAIAASLVDRQHGKEGKI